MIIVVVKFNIVNHLNITFMLFTNDIMYYLTLWIGENKNIKLF